MITLMTPWATLRTYFLIAGIAGISPYMGTLGSVTVARFAVQGQQILIREPQHSLVNFIDLTPTQSLSNMSSIRDRCLRIGLEEDIGLSELPVLGFAPPLLIFVSQSE